MNRKPLNLDYPQPREGAMLRRQLASMVEDAASLRAALHPDDNVPGWTIKKVATAEDRLHSASAYLRQKIADQTGVRRIVNYGSDQVGFSYDGYGAPTMPTVYGRPEYFGKGPIRSSSGGRGLLRQSFAKRRLERFKARLADKSPEEIEEIEDRLEERLERIEGLIASGRARRPEGLQRRQQMVQSLLSIVREQSDADLGYGRLPAIGSDPLDSIKPLLPLFAATGLLFLAFSMNNRTPRRKPSRKRRSTTKKRRSRRTTRR